MARVSVAGLLLAGSLGLSGCDFFFQCAKASCTDNTSGTTVTNTGDFAYVSNSTSGSTYLAAYNVGGGALTAVSGSPFSLGYLPVSMKVSPNNAFLYVGSATGGIYLYSISSTGALTAASNNPQITTSTSTLSSLDISSDGDWLFALDATGVVLSEYSLNSSTGALMGPSVFSVPGVIGATEACSLIGSPASQNCTVKVSPTINAAGYVGVALGTAGTVVFPYTSSGGITTQSFVSIPCCSTVASPFPSQDFSLAFDSNNYLYVARTLAVASYGNVGAAAPTYEGSVTYAAGIIPRAITLSNNDTYLYTANEGAGTISGFGLSGAGVLTGLSGSPYTGPTNVSALGWDNTSTYLIAVGYNASSGVQLFKPSAGVLGSAVASAGTGTTISYPALVALTH